MVLGTPTLLLLLSVLLVWLRLTDRGPTLRRPLLQVLVGDMYGTAIDVWSYGCTLAELASGRPLFPGGSFGPAVAVQDG